MRYLFFILLSVSLLFASQVSVGTYVINAGRFDPQSGTYTVDFYLSLKCESNCSSNFEFVNGRANTIDKIIDEPTEKFYRIQATLQDNVDFRKFPFDTHTLTIRLEDKTQTKEDQFYIINEKETGLSDSINFIGWELKGWNANVVDNYYSVYDENYSTYIFSINLKREWVSSFLKTFVPIFFIMLLNFFAHFPDPDKITNRLTMHTSFIIAAVMFHVAIGNQLPPLGYLTLADKFMFASYLSLGFSLLSAIVVLELVEEKKMNLVTKVHKMSGLASFFIWIISLVIIFLTR